MCMVAFLGTDAVLDTTAFSPDAPAFYVGRPSPHEHAVRTRFGASHVYVLGSHTGCGCGFGFGETYADEHVDPDEADSRRQLADRLRTLVEAGHAAEVYVCWSGDEAAPPVRRLSLTPDAFLEPARIAEGDTIRLISASSAPA